MSKYTFSIGRCKGATCQLKLYTAGSGEILVNDKDFKVYFPTLNLQYIVNQPLKYYATPNNLKLVFKVNGGGKSGQAKACCLALARALVILDANIKPALKKVGLMTRDPRVKERKKPGLKRARRAPQWQKR